MQQAGAMKNSTEPISPFRKQWSFKVSVYDREIFEEFVIARIVDDSHLHSMQFSGDIHQGDG